MSDNKEFNIFPVLWAQVDANMHLRHSAYADFGAQSRLQVLNKFGINAHLLKKHKIGPVLFREELIYHREISLGDSVSISCELTKSTKSGSRWTIQHEIFRGDGTKAATIIVDGAWLDLEKRKLAEMPEAVSALFNILPKSENFTLIEKK